MDRQSVEMSSRICLWVFIAFGMQTFSISAQTATESGSNVSDELLNGDDDPALTDLKKAQLLIAEGKGSEAVPTLQQAVALFEKQGRELDEATAWHELGKALPGWPEREQAWRKALEIRERRLGPDDVEANRTRLNLGLARFNQGDRAAAEALDRQAMTAFEKHLPADDPLLALARNNLANVLESLSRHSDAEKLYREVHEARRNSKGDEDPETLYSLGQLAWALKNQEKWLEAEVVFRNLSDARTRVLGADVQPTLWARHNLAWVLSQQTKYPEAEKIASDAFAGRNRVLGADHAETLASEHLLAWTLSQQNSFEEAEQLGRDVLARRSKTLGVDHSDTLWSQYNLANTLSKEDRFKESEILHRQVWESRSRILGPEHNDTLWSRSNIAWNLFQQGKYAEAERLYREVIAACERVLGPEHGDTLTFRHDLVMLLRESGRLREAHAIGEEVLAARERTQGKDHADTIGALNCLGIVCWNLGDLTRAERLYREALRRGERTLKPDDSELIWCRQNLAVTLGNRGDIEEEERLLRIVIEQWERIVGREHLNTLQSVDNLALVLGNRGKQGDAEALHREVLAGRTRILGEEHQDTLKTLHNLALCLSNQGKHAESETLYRQTLAIRLRTIGKDHRDTLVNMRNLAEELADQEKWDEVDSLMQNAIEGLTRTLGVGHPDTIACVSGFAELLIRQNKKEQAREHLKEACEGATVLLNRIAWGLSDQAQLVATQNFRYCLDRYCRLAVKDGSAADELWIHVVALKGAMLARQRALQLFAATDQALQERLAKFVAKSNELSSLLNQQSPSAGGTGSDWQQDVERLAAEKELLQIELGQYSEAVREKFEPRTADVVRKAIPAGTLLVDLFSFQGQESRQVAAFLVRQEGEIKLVDLGSESDLGDLVQTWRAWYTVPPHQRLAGSEGRQAALRAGAELRKRIWEQFEPHLGSADVVLISPDGALCEIPWGALPANDPNKYLIEEHAVAIIPAPQLMPDLVTAASRERTYDGLALVMGGIDYGPLPGTLSPQLQGAPEPDLSSDFGIVLTDAFNTKGALPIHRSAPRAAGLAFKPLIHTEPEAKEIARQFRSIYRKESAAKLVLGTEATEAAFAALAPRYRLLHVSTHGFFRPDLYQRNIEIRTAAEGLRLGRQPVGVSPGLLSGLVFAGANRPAEGGLGDGILTAEELASLDLSGVQLAVLSACETGLGEQAAGEGLLGIQRAMHTAGVKTVVASLWEVDDIGTYRLMKRFYEDYTDPRDETRRRHPLVALGAAQKWLLENPDQTRGVDLERTDDLPDLPPDPASTRTDPYFWAPFVLSGDWR